MYYALLLQHTSKYLVTAWCHSVTRPTRSSDVGCILNDANTSFWATARSPAWPRKRNEPWTPLGSFGPPGGRIRRRVTAMHLLLPAAMREKTMPIPSQDDSSVLFLERPSNKVHLYYFIWDIALVGVHRSCRLLTKDRNYCLHYFPLPAPFFCNKLYYRSSIEPRWHEQLGKAG